MRLCEWQPVVGQSPSDTMDGELLRYRCVHCGELTPPLYRDSLPSLECKANYSGRTVVQPPNLLKQLANFGTEFAKHVANGTPRATRIEILESFRICSGCDRYSDLTGQCGECGCYVNLALHCENLNKLAWADQECPIGKWVSPLRR